MRLGRTTAALAATVALAALAGCGGDGSSTAGPSTSAPSHRSPSGGEAKTGSEAKAGGGTSPGKRSVHGSAEPGKREPATLVPSHCPPGHPACRTTEGRIVYIEHVDPDGDGDAHFVVVDPQSITLPGLTAIDVRAGLRPHPLPKLGDRVSAAGPVQTGHLGQDQIHALELHVAE